MSFEFGKCIQQKQTKEKASTYIDNICTAEQQEAIEVVIFGEEQQ